MRLETVLEIVDAFVGSEIPVWIGGGWGIDALVGMQTREHDDLDIAIRQEDESSALSLLDEMGFHIVEDQDWRPVRVGLRGAYGEEVDLHPVTFDGTGIGWQANLGSLPPFRYPPDQLVVGTLGERPVPCIGPQLQLQFHFGYEAAEKDRRDVRLLCERLGLELPPI